MTYPLSKAAVEAATPATESIEAATRQLIQHRWVTDERVVAMIERSLKS